MSEGLHYRFPPACAYRLNRCLFVIKSDAAFRARYVADPKAALHEMGLSGAEQAALLACDHDGLIARGAHPYLVFMADLRLRMDARTMSFEYF